MAPIFAAVAGWDALIFNASWASGGSSAGFFKRSDCTGDSTGDSMTHKSFTVKNHGGVYSQGNIAGEHLTAYLRYSGGCNQFAGSTIDNRFACDGRVMLNFAVGNCTPQTPGPESKGTCTDSVSGYKIAMHVQALPTSGRPPSKYASSDHKVCSGMAKPPPNEMRPLADEDDTSCCPADFCRGPQKHEMIPDIWGDCEFATGPSAEANTTIHSGHSYAVDVTDLLRRVGPAGGKDIHPRPFPCDPTLKLFPSTTFVTDGWDISVELSNVTVQCVNEPVTV